MYWKYIYSYGNGKSSPDGNSNTIFSDNLFRKREFNSFNIKPCIGCNVFLGSTDNDECFRWNSKQRCLYSTDTYSNIHISRYSGLFRCSDDYSNGLCGFSNFSNGNGKSQTDYILIGNRNRLQRRGTELYDNQCCCIQLQLVKSYSNRNQ